MEPGRHPRAGLEPRGVRRHPRRVERLHPSRRCGPRRRRARRGHRLGRGVHLGVPLPPQVGRLGDHPRPGAYPARRDGEGRAHGGGDVGSHGATHPRGAAPAGSAHGGRGPARRGHRPRLQQPPHGDPGLDRARPATAPPRPPGPRRARHHPPHRRARRRADPRAAGLRPPPGALERRARPQRGDPSGHPPAAPDDPREHRHPLHPGPRHRHRAGRPWPAHADSRQPLCQRPGRHARRRRHSRAHGQCEPGDLLGGVQPRCDQEAARCV